MAVSGGVETRHPPPAAERGASEGNMQLRFECPSCRSAPEPCSVDGPCKGTGWIQAGACEDCGRLRSAMRTASDLLHASFRRPSREVNAACAQARKLLESALKGEAPRDLGQQYGQYIIGNGAKPKDIPK